MSAEVIVEAPCNTEEVNVDSNLSNLSNVIDFPAAEKRIEIGNVIVRAKNSPHLVRSSFFKYLKEDFVDERDWRHPATQATYTTKQVREALQAYKHMNPSCYRALWATWTTGASRDFIADHFRFSGSTIKRRTDEGVSIILLMLFFPELHPKDFKLYDVV